MKFWDLLAVLRLADEFVLAVEEGLLLLLGTHNTHDALLHYSPAVTCRYHLGSWACVHLLRGWPEITALHLLPIVIVSIQTGNEIYTVVVVLPSLDSVVDKRVNKFKSVFLLCLRLCGLVSCHTHPFFVIKAIKNHLKRFGALHLFEYRWSKK